jgi:hypothetical protein
MSNKLSVVQVADINPGSGDSFPLGFTESRGELYFRASEPEEGQELYKVARDGTVTGHTDWCFG